MKKTIKLQILTEDIRTSDYQDIHDCAIARAIKRLSSNMKIEYHVSELEIEGRFIDIDALENTVLGMYKYVHNEREENFHTSQHPEKPKDFEYIVEYEE